MDARIWRVRSDRDLAAALRIACRRIGPTNEPCNAILFDMDGRVI
jgi:hypothetical protein